MDIAEISDKIFVIKLFYVYLQSLPKEKNHKLYYTNDIMNTWIVDECYCIKLYKMHFHMEINGSLHNIIRCEHIYDSISNGDHKENVFSLARRAQDRKNDHDI